MVQIWHIILFQQVCTPCTVFMLVLGLNDSSGEPVMPSNWMKSYHVAT